VKREIEKAEIYRETFASILIFSRSEKARLFFPARKVVLKR